MQLWRENQHVDLQPAEELGIIKTEEGRSDVTAATRLLTSDICVNSLRSLLIQPGSCPV